MRWSRQKHTRFPVGWEVLLYLLVWLVGTGGLSCSLGRNQGATVSRSNCPSEEAPSSRQSVLIAQPDYPEEARRLGLQGSVDVLAKVDEEGRVIDAQISRSTNEIFNEAALKAAYGCRFRMMTGGGQRVPARVSIPFRFTLPDSG